MHILIQYFYLPSYYITNEILSMLLYFRIIDTEGKYKYKAFSVLFIQKSY